MGGILVIAEHLRGAVNTQTAEAIGLARGLKSHCGGRISVAVISDEPSRYSDELMLDGVDEIVLVPAPTDHFDAAIYEEATVQLVTEMKSRLVLIGHSVNGMGFGPAVAVRLGGSLVSDAFAVEMTDERMQITRGGYGNKVLTKLDVTNHCITTLMVRSGSAKPPPRKETFSRTVTIDFGVVTEKFAQHGDYIDPPPADVDISKADFILSIGRGVQDEKHIERFRDLATRLGATFGCSRPIADAGWLSKAHQVGLSGMVAQNCKFYIALGISGAVQHLHGMKHVETIVAINTDRNAPIYNVATHGAAVDLFEFADALQKALD